MSKDAERPVVVRGNLRIIEYAVCSNGSMPAKDFIETLTESDQRKLDTLFRRMAETGKIFNREQFKLVEGKIYEFKRFQIRIGCFLLENRWLLTNGFVKKGDKWPKSELDRAERVRTEHLNR